MFLCMLKTMIRTKTIGETDRYIVLADKDSMQVLKETNMLCNLEMIEIPKPSSHLEGMLYKYRLHEFLNLEGKECWYLDVDMLFVNQMKMFPAPDRLICFPEGSPTEKNYCGSFTLDAKVGVTAGCFAYNFGPLVKKTFERIKELASQTSETFYTIEQPFFNKALELNPPILLEPSLISFNGANLEKARILNCAGEPGDAMFHWKKMFAFFLRFF